MLLKPFRDYSEHDVVNLFALNVETGAKGSVVKIVGNGFVNNNSYGIAKDINGGVLGANDSYSPRYEVKAKVGFAGAAETSKPLGITLYDVKEVNQWNYPLIYDKARRDEAQAVVSGMAVPIVRKGIFLVKPDAGVAGIGSGLAPAANGGTTVVDLSKAVQCSGAFGEFLGVADADGYALASLNFYK